MWAGHRLGGALSVPARPPARCGPGSPRRIIGAFALLLVALATAPGTARAATPQPAPHEAAPPRFSVAGFEVEGNTVLPAHRIHEVLSLHTGADRSFTDVQAAADALQQAYARAGFGAVRVSLPEQRLMNGVVRLIAVEPPLRSVTITGNTHFDSASIRRSLPALRRSTTPNTDDLAAQIRLANENPARRISVELRRDENGGIEATVSVVDEKPWKVGLLLDNTGTPATGRLRSGVFLQHANAADRGDVLSVQYVTSPGHVKEVTIGAINYRLTVPPLGDAVDLYAVHADVDSGVVSDLFNVRARGSVLGLRYQLNLPPTAAIRHRLLAGLERRTFDNQVGLVGGSRDLLADVTAHPASLGYAATWTGERLQLELGATLVRNLPGGTNGRGSDFEAARTGARAGYSLLRWSAGITQTLPGAWQLRAVGEGQATRDPLIAGEQFGIGGQDSVRGFLEREISSDKGARASFELRSPDLGVRLGAGVAAQALVFYDLGHVARNAVLPGEVASANIASIGAGLRVTIAPRATARLDLAHVLRGAGLRVRGDERAHFSLGVAY